MTSPVTFQTANRLIRLAYKDAGLLQDGDEPNGEQLAEAMTRMNDMVNLWQTQGLKLFLLTDQSVTLVAGQSKYTLKPSGDVNIVKPLRALQAYYRDINGVRRPLVPLSWDEWNRLSIINQTGQINSYFVDKQVLELDVYFWLVPDTTAATGTAHLLLENQVTNVVSLTDNYGFPMEWAMALRWGLADELATGQPTSIMQRCETKARAYREALEDWDVEDAPTTFTPDQRVLYAGQAFR